jgi:hypothetical protein
MPALGLALGPSSQPRRRASAASGAPAGIAARAWGPTVWGLSATGQTGPRVATSKVPGIDTLPAGASWNAGTRTVTVSGDGVTLTGWDFNDALIVLTAGGTNCTIQDCRFDAQRQFIAISNPVGASAAGTTIQWCLFDGKKAGTNWIPMSLYGPNCTVTRNRIRDTPSDGISLYGSGTCTFNHITAGGYRFGAHFDAIYVGRTSGVITISDNLIDMTDPGDYVDIPGNYGGIHPINNAFRAVAEAADILHEVLFTENVVFGGPAASYRAQVFATGGFTCSGVRVIDNLWRAAQIIHPSMAADTVWSRNADLDTLAAIEVTATAATAAAGGSAAASYSFGIENAQAVADNRALVMPTGAMRLPAPGTNWAQGIFLRTSDLIAQSGGNEVIGQKGTTATATSGNDSSLFLAEATSATGLRPRLVLRNGSVDFMQSGEYPAVALEREQDYLLVWGQIGATPFFSCVRCHDQSVIFNIVGAANNGATSFYNLSSVARWNDSSTFYETMPNWGCAFGMASGDKSGFSGSISNIFNITGTFPNTSGTPAVATLQALARGETTIAALVTAMSGTLRYHNPLTFGSLAADGTGTVTDAASEVGTAASVTPRAGDPIRRPPSILTTRHRLADGAVIGRVPGQSTADISITGSWSVSAGAPGGIQARLVRVSDGTALAGFDWADLDDLRMAGGNFSGWLRGVPAGTTFRVEVRMRRTTSILFACQARMQVGDVILDLSQSQQQIQYIAAATTGGGANSVLTPTNSTDRFAAVIRHVGGLADSGTGDFAPSHGPKGFVGVLRPSMAGQIGDGVVARANRLATLRGNAVAMIDASRGGHHPYHYYADRTSKTISAAFTPNGSSTGPFTGTLTPPDVPAGISTTPTVLPNSIAFTVRFSGVDHQIIDNGSGALTGTNVSSGTINYATGAYSLTFSAAPQAVAVPVTWTYVSDYIAGGSTAKSTLNQFGAIGTGADGTGVVSDVMQRLRRDGNRVSVIVVHWSTSMAGRFNTTNEGTYAAARDNDYWAHFDALKSRLEALFAECIGARWVFAGAHREVPTSGTTEGADRIKYGQIRRAIREGLAGRAWAYDGGDYHDLGVSGASSTQSGPHQDFAGAQVIGERHAVAIHRALGGTIEVRGPRIASAQFTDGGRTAIRLTYAFEDGAATALVTKDGSTTGLVGFDVGDTITTRATTGFTAAITAANQVTITKTSGAWAAGALVGYAVGSVVFTGTLTADKTNDDLSLQKVLYDNVARTTLQAMPGMPAQSQWSITVADA